MVGYQTDSYYINFCDGGDYRHSIHVEISFPKRLTLSLNISLLN